MNPHQKKMLARILVSFALFILIGLLPLETWLGPTHAVYAEFCLYLIPYLIAGYDVIAGAFRNIGRGQLFDEDFLMTVATFGAFALVFFPESEPHMAEGAAVMIFFQTGELFQDYAVNKSRKSIADMMDIAPEYANIMRDGQLEQVDPYELSPGDIFVVKPGERVPLDGIVIAGASQLDTAALTGESLPRHISHGDEVLSGCINMTSTLTVEAIRPFEDSTVSRILELVESAADKKARTESFITRFARYYTPIVVAIAAALAIIPPLLFALPWNDWVQRGLIFLVVSCPCALVISVPLSFFGGIGGASRLGILVKGSNYLEALASVDTVVFDKTGTLTTGSFRVTDVEPAPGFANADLLEYAACAEALSNHPIAASVRAAYAEHYQGTIDVSRITQSEDHSGQGVHAIVDGTEVLAGNDKLMRRFGVECAEIGKPGTVLHVSVNGSYAGHLVISDELKPNAAQAIADLRSSGIKKTVMLTGDRRSVAAAVASKLGIDEFHAELLPQDKVSEIEGILEAGAGSAKTAFVGDGINDAPVLARADVGIAMGAMGSDAAIEAADIVLMDDNPLNIARAIRIARKTMAIVWQNIVFAIGIKFLVLGLAAFGVANMWLAVFADVGVAVLAILNAMRAMSVRKLR